MAWGALSVRMISLRMFLAYTDVIVKKLIFPQILLLLSACEPSGESPVAEEPWPNEAEVLFQEAEALKYEVERRRVERKRLGAQGLEGAPPLPRP